MALFTLRRLGMPYVHHDDVAGLSTKRTFHQRCLQARLANTIEIQSIHWDSGQEQQTLCFAADRYQQQFNHQTLVLPLTYHRYSASGL